MLHIISHFIYLLITDVIGNLLSQELVPLRQFLLQRIGFGAFFSYVTEKTYCIFFNLYFLFSRVNNFSSLDQTMYAILVGNIIILWTGCNSLTFACSLVASTASWLSISSPLWDILLWLIQFESRKVLFIFSHSYNYWPTLVARS